MTDPAIVQELRDLYEEDGILAPERVVERAGDPASALNKCFEWDDGVAAQAYRISQAEYLIRSVKVVLEPREDVKLRVREWVSLPSDRGVGYRQIERILPDTDKRQELLAMARADLRAFTRRYEVLDELAGVFAAIREVI